MSGPRGARASLLVDARALQMGGIGRYLREILARLLAKAPFDRVTLLGDVAELGAFVGGHPSPAQVEAVPHPGHLYSLRSQASWALLRASGKASADVGFFPHWDAPVLLTPRRSVVTVHDLIHFRVPDAFPPVRLRAARAVLRRAISRATLVIADSESTRADLEALESSAREKTRVITLGVSEAFHPPASDEALPAGVRAPFLLCVGNKKRHKNLEAAVAVLATILARRPEMQLVVAGRAFDGWESVLEGAADRGVGASVVNLPVVTDAELRVLYGRCAAFVFPSRYEGFGLPVLEAMACGAPVVASNVSSVPEIAGDAAVLCDPSDVAGMAVAVERLLTDGAHRETLVRAGFARAAGYRWDAAAKATIGVLLEAAAR